MYSGDVPDYIKNISSPIRKRHFDSLLKKASKVILQLMSCHLNNLRWKDVSTTYNAWEEDFAVLNIFFGQESVLGWALKIEALFNFMMFFLFIQTWNAASQWALLTLSLLLAVSLAFSLGSASSRSVRSSTGLLYNCAEI